MFALQSAARTNAGPNGRLPRSGDRPRSAAGNNIKAGFSLEAASENRP